MAKFSFRLQTFLEQKVEAARAARAEVSEKRHAWQLERNMLSDLVQREAQVQLEAQGIRNGLLSGQINNVTDIQRRNSYLEGLEEDLRAAHEAVIVQSFAVEEAELALFAAEALAVERAREAETIEKYREKLEKRFLDAIAKKEETEVDETGTIGFLSRRATA